MTQGVILKGLKDNGQKQIDQEPDKRTLQDEDDKDGKLEKLSQETFLMNQNVTL